MMTRKVTTANAAAVIHVREVVMVTVLEAVMDVQVDVMDPHVSTCDLTWAKDE